MYTEIYTTYLSILKFLSRVLHIHITVVGCIVESATQILYNIYIHLSCLGKLIVLPLNTLKLFCFKIVSLVKVI